MRKTILQVSIILFMGMTTAGIQTMSAQNTTIIFEDQSGSVQPTEVQVKKQEQILKKPLLERIEKKGDKVILSYLYKNTGSISNAKAFVYTPMYSTLSPASKAQKTREKMREMRAKFLLVSRILNALDADVVKSDETHILASIPKIHQQLQRSDSVEVIYLSDMLEWSPTRRLYLTSKADAEAKGKIDAQKIIEAYSLKKIPASNLKITCFLPVGMMHNGKTFSYVSYYWKTVFYEIFNTQNIYFQAI